MRVRLMSRALAQVTVLGLAMVVTAAPDVAAQAQGRGAAPAAPAAPTPRRPDGKPILGAVPGQPVGGWGADVTTLPAGKKLEEIPFQPWARRSTTSARSTSSNRIPVARLPASRGSFRRRTAPSSSRSPTSSGSTSWTTAVPIRSGSSIWMVARSRRTSRRPTTDIHRPMGSDSLVVETRGLNEKFWMDTRGTPHTVQLKFTERFTRTDMNTLQVSGDDRRSRRLYGTVDDDRVQLALETRRRAVRIHLPAEQPGPRDDARQPGRHRQYALLRSLIMRVTSPMRMICTRLILSHRDGARPDRDGPGRLSARRNLVRRLCDRRSKARPDHRHEVGRTKGHRDNQSRRERDAAQVCGDGHHSRQAGARGREFIDGHSADLPREDGIRAPKSDGGGAIAFEGTIKNPVAGNRTIVGTFTRGSEKGPLQLRRL